jgi:di/tricarboxylate transporter
MFVAALLTQLMSGQVTAIVMIPLALVSAQRIGIDPRPFAMAVAMGCSLAFISPLGHPVNIIVMNPGGYTLKDYVKVGLPLTIAAFLCVIFAIKLYWGL